MADSTPTLRRLREAYPDSDVRRRYMTLDHTREQHFAVGQGAVAVLHAYVRETSPGLEWARGKLWSGVRAYAAQLGLTIRELPSPPDDSMGAFGYASGLIEEVVAPHRAKPAELSALAALEEPG